MPDDYSDILLAQDASLRLKKETADYQSMLAEYNRGLRANPPQQPSGGVLADIGAGAMDYLGKRITPRFPSWPDVNAPSTKAAAIGQSLPLMGPSMALPGSGWAGMAAQGLLSAAGEAADPRASVGSIAGAGATSAALTGVFDLAGRALSGMSSRVYKAITQRGDEITRTQSQQLRTVAETFGGMGALNRADQRVLNRAAASAIGETGDAVTSEMRNQAAQRIGKVMDAALPTGPVDVTEAYLILDEIPGLPNKSAILAALQKAESDPKAYQAVSRMVRDASRLAPRTPALAAYADQIHTGLEALLTAGEAAGAADTRIVREQFKNLSLLEGMGALRRTGNVPALSAEEAIFRKYGPGVARRAGEGLKPATQRFIETTQLAAEEAAARFRSSGTAERQVGAEVAKDVMGFMTGTTSPSGLARTLGTLTLAGPVLGMAAIGKPVTGAGQAGAALGRAIQPSKRSEE